MSRDKASVLSAESVSQSCWNPGAAVYRSGERRMAMLMDRNKPSKPSDPLRDYFEAVAFEKNRKSDLVKPKKAKKPARHGSINMGRLLK
jgi:hypothetical protein